MSEVNIPLLRKAVEWAEAEAAKTEDCHWYQGSWAQDATNFRILREDFPQRYGNLATCGTAYCIAGHVAASIAGEENIDLCQFMVNVEGNEVAIPDFAKEQLGLGDRQADRLFNGGNSIEDVRRIAEQIAGEKL